MSLTFHAKELFPYLKLQIPKSLQCRHHNTVPKNTPQKSMKRLIFYGNLLCLHDYISLTYIQKPIHIFIGQKLMSHQHQRHEQISQPFYWQTVTSQLEFCKDLWPKLFRLLYVQILSKNDSAAAALLKLVYLFPFLQFSFFSLKFLFHLFQILNLKKRYASIKQEYHLCIL